MSVAVVVGNPKPRSRTWQAAHHVAAELAGRPADVDLDLTDLGAALLDWSSEPVREAVAQVLASRLVVVASPTYKGAYTGLLKLFLDRFDAGSLAATTAIPLMLGGGPQHALAPEYTLKPVLAELGASTPTRGLYLIDREWDSSPELTRWLDIARTQIGTVVL